MGKQSVFITGASSGIGLATALHMRSLGFQVFAGVLPGEDTAPLFRDGTQDMTVVPINITRSEMIVAARQTIQAAVGDSGLYGLFNNAGISIPGPIEFLPMPAVRKQLEVNLLGHVEVTQTFLPLIRQAKGRIVNTASILGRFSTPFGAPYSMAKFGMEAFTDSLRLELRPYGVRVIAIEPGAIATNIWSVNHQNADEILSEFTPEAEMLYGAAFREVCNAAQQTGKRGIPPHKVAKAVAHAFTSPRPKTRYLVGQDAHMLGFLKKVLPDVLMDRLLTRSVVKTAR